MSTNNEPKPASPADGATIARRWDPAAHLPQAPEQAIVYGAEAAGGELPLPGYVQTTLVLTESDYNRYHDDKSTLAVARYDRYRNAKTPSPVSAMLINDVVLKDGYYAHLERLARTRATDNFQVSYWIGGDSAGTVSIPLANVAEALQQQLSAGVFDDNPVAMQRIAEFAQLTSVEQIGADYRGATYRTTIDGEMCGIPAERLVALLLADDDSYQSFLENGAGFDIPKEHVAYALVNFVRGNGLLSRYSVPDRIFKRYEALASYEQIDFEAIGRLVAIDEQEPARQVVMNDELHNLILEDMPTGLTDLERAMYVYVKMCRVLSYDPEYYAVDQKGPITRRFQDITRTSTITPENNRLVCFEFNALFESFLSELGIPYETKYGEASRPDRQFINAGYYGEGHEYCECRIDGTYIVAFDSVTSILGGDLSSAKLQQELQGMICRNRNEQTRRAFQKVAAHAYQHAVLPQAQERPLGGDDEAFQQAITAYHELAHGADRSSVSFEDRLTRWMDAFSRQRLAPMDALSYALLMQRVGFTEDQRHNNFSLTIVRENHEDGVAAAPVMVLAVNPQGFGSPDVGNTYFILHTEGEAMPVSLDDLRRRFSSQQYEYLAGPEEHAVPGLAVVEETHA